MISSIIRNVNLLRFKKSASSVNEYRWIESILDINKCTNIEYGLDGCDFAFCISFNAPNGKRHAFSVYNEFTGWDANKSKDRIDNISDAIVYCLSIPAE